MDNININKIADNIKKTGKLMLKNGENSESIAYQIPKFEDVPLIYTSFYCEGYEGNYYSDGIVFEIKDPIAYATPSDALSLMRSGSFLPDHEQFIFSSIEKMLDKYPDAISFRKDFVKYFKGLNAKEIFPGMGEDAKQRLEFDYALRSEILKNKNNYNEITFRNPIVDVELISTFNSKEELKKIFENYKV